MSPATASALFARAGDAWQNARAEMARMTKPPEVEGVLDTYLIRPIGFVFVQSLRRTAVTPNMVSVAAMLAGIGIGFSYLGWHRQSTGAWLGLLFMLLHSGLDAADGQLARVTGRTSQLGRLVDGVCDNASFIAIYVCLVVAHALSGGVHPWLFLGLAAAAGLSHSTHCALTERQRMLFLNYVYGTHDTIAERPEPLRQMVAQARRERWSWPRRALARLQLNYSLQQRFFLRSGDDLERVWLHAVQRRPELRPWFAQRYRAANTGMLRAWTLLGPNSHKVALVATAFVAALVTTGPIGRAGMMLYLFYDLVVLNLVMGVLVVVQARVDWRLACALAAELPARGPAGAPGAAGARAVN